MAHSLVQLKNPCPAVAELLCTKNLVHQTPGRCDTALCRVTSLVTKFDHRLALRIETALKAGQSLDQLSGEPEHVVR